MKFLQERVTLSFLKLVAIVTVEFLPVTLSFLNLVAIVTVKFLQERVTLSFLKLVAIVTVVSARESYVVVS